MASQTRRRSKYRRTSNKPRKKCQKREKKKVIIVPASKLSANNGPNINAINTNLNIRWQKKAQNFRIVFDYWI